MDFPACVGLKAIPRNGAVVFDGSFAPLCDIALILLLQDFSETSPLFLDIRREKRGFLVLYTETQKKDAERAEWVLTQNHLVHNR